MLAPVGTNAKHMGDGRAAVGVPATEGSEWCNNMDSPSLSGIDVPH